MALTESQYQPGMMVRGGSQLGDIPTGADVRIQGGFIPQGQTQYDATTAGNISRGTSIYGLSTAQQLYDAQQMAYREGRNTYPGFVASQQKAPEQAAMYNYQATSPLQQIQAPNYQYNAGSAPTYQNANVGINPYMGSMPNAPGNLGRVNVEQNQFMQNAQAPTVGPYQGLMGGDYEALQQALQQPGQLEAQRAYELGQKQLEQKMGGQGLYGSSMMGTSMSELNRGYQETLAKNAAMAAQQRYGMQAQDLAAQNQFGIQTGQLGANVYGTQLQAGLGQTQQQINQNLGLGQIGSTTYGQQLQAGTALSGQALTQAQQQAQLELGVYGANLTQQQSQNAWNLQNMEQQRTQAYDVYKTQAAETAAQQAYAQQGQAYNQSYLDQSRQWQNQAATEQYQYQLAQRAYQQQMDEQMLNRALALAGQGAPLSQAGTQYQMNQQTTAAQQAAAQTAARAATTGSYLGAAGTVAGGLLGNASTASAIGQGLTGMYQTASNWLNPQQQPYTSDNYWQSGFGNQLAP